MNHNTAFFVLLALLFGTCQFPKEPAKDNDVSDFADSLTVELQGLQAQGPINGFSVAVVDSSGALYQNGFGYAEKNLGKRFTENTLINVGSITKTTVGLSLLKAQEMGLLSLDDPINDHLSFRVQNPYFPDEPITLRHLANHTSTIIDSDYFHETCYVMLKQTESLPTTPTIIPEFFNDPADTTSLAVYMERMLTEEGTGYSKGGFLNAKPGERYQYSNTGAGLAALVVETVWGGSFAAFARQHIFAPLNMGSSGLKRTELAEERFSKNYATVDTAFVDYQLINYPDGGLLTSASDLSKLLAELIRGYHGGGSILTSQSFETMFAKGVAEDLFGEVDVAIPPVLNTRLDQGIFMALGPQNTFGHSGADPGVVSFMFFNGETGIGRILIVNMGIDSLEQPAAKELLAVWAKLEEYQGRLSTEK